MIGIDEVILTLICWAAVHGAAGVDVDTNA
jgi:hypothetical protein